MMFELARLSKYTDAAIVAELQRVAGIVPARLPLTTTVFNHLAKVHASTVRNRFGTWDAALRAAGLSNRYSNRAVSEKMHAQHARSMSDSDLADELKRVARAVNASSLTQPQFNSRSAISATSIARRYGSWGAALKAAGLTPVAMGRRYSKSDYFENLLNVWTHYGRQPSYAEMNRPPSHITGGAYEKRWGTWRKALGAFVAVANNGSPEPTTVLHVEPSVTPTSRLAPEDRRRVPLGLRYQVLRRDNFKCAVCGNSPAADPGCVLHVDHIIPFSLGGKTIESNLRALCAQCNIGKSNK